MPFARFATCELSQRDLSRVSPNNVTQLVGCRLQVATGGLQVGVSEQILHPDHVGAGLEGLGGERVAEGVDQGTHRLLGAETSPPVQPRERQRPCWPTASSPQGVTPREK